MSMRPSETYHQADVGDGVDGKMSQMGMGGDPSFDRLDGQKAELGEGYGYNNSEITTPLERCVVASVRATLSDLCNSRSKACWAPSSDALNSIFQQKRFSDLSGAAQQSGDLKNAVLHSVTSKAVKSTFPLSLGIDMTGVDSQTFSHTGTSFSTIVLPRVDTTSERVLQKDDPQVAYDFMARYPGYTAQNLETKDVHAVPNRRFVLVSKEHPLMQAIHDNRHALQSTEFSEMPEGLVKINTSLYDAVMPVVRSQVESQVRVRDFSKFSVSISPSDHASWQAAMEQLTAEHVRPIKSDRTRALAAADKGDSGMIAKINAKYDDMEHSATQKIQNTPMEFHIEAEIKYNFMAG